MSTPMSPVLVLVAGAAVGLGLALVVRAVVPAMPDPLSTLARRRALGSARADLAGQVPPTRREVTLAWAVDRLGLARYVSDLQLVDETAAGLLVRKVGYAVLGLAFPPVLVALMAVVGLALPWVVPTLFGVVLGAVLFLVPDVDLRHRAAVAREDLRAELSVYLELVALERAADSGASEALDRAAAVGDSRFFGLMRDELVRSQLRGEPAWRSFDRLATRVGVDELADVADIMRLTGEDGASVYSTLRARAASLRGALLTQEAAKANAASEQMVVPVALLGVAFLLLLGYPAFARIVFG
jgi:hypothetical protein